MTPQLNGVGLPSKRDIRGLVERTRAGDQNAMALIAGVRDLAAQGNPRSIYSKNLIEKYIAKYPPDSNIGQDAAPSVNTNPRAFYTLWTARETSPEKYAIIVAKSSPFVQVWQAVVAIVNGPRLTKTNPLMQTVDVKGSRIAGIVRKAFLIQRLQNPRVPIGSYCKQTGWELGE